MSYKSGLAKQTGQLGPTSTALWPKMNGTTGAMYSLGAAPLIYNTTTGIYNTAYDANAAVSSASFGNLSFGKRKSRKRRKSRKSRRKSYRKSRKSRRKSRKSRKSRSFGKRKSHKSRISKRWSSPSKKSRRKIFKKCGKKCFLSPNNLKFPICNQDCGINPRGLHAAYKRAVQYGYTEVAKKAKKMMDEDNRATPLGKH